MNLIILKIKKDKDAEMNENKINNENGNINVF